MSLITKDLRTYADQGLRTPADWLTRGREIAPECKPRCEEKSGSQVITLFSRDQTQVRKSTR